MRPWILPALVVLAVTTPAGAWTRNLGSWPYPLAAGPHATIFGAVARAKSPRIPILTAFSADRGKTLWRTRWRGTGTVGDDQVNALSVTPDGDLVVTGMLKAPAPERFVVARFDGGDGRMQWRTALQVGSTVGGAGPRAVAVTPAGDVAVVGDVRVSSPGVYTGETLLAVLLDGATGAERWRLVGDDAGGSFVVAGADGSVYVAALPTPRVTRIMPDGRVGWSRTVPGLLDVRDMTLGRSGDVVVGATAAQPSGDTGNAFGVASLSATTGEPQWLTRTSRASGRWQAALRVVTDPDGAIYAAGILNDGSGAASSERGGIFTIMRLDPADGSIDWTYEPDGPALGGRPWSLTLSPGGVVAAGYRNDLVSCGDGFAVELDRATGAVSSSETFDGSFATPDCFADCYHASCPVDNDSLHAMVVDSTGRVVVSGGMLNGRRGRTHVSFLRSLAW